MRRRENKDKKDEIFDIDEFDVEIDPQEPVYPLNVVCRLLGLNYWTLHEIVEEGLVHCEEKSRKNKLFSYRDIKRLKYIKYLIEDKGVNIKGIKVIFEIKGDI